MFRSQSKYPHLLDDNCSQGITPKAVNLSLYIQGTPKNYFSISSAKIAEGNAILFYKRIVSKIQGIWEEEAVWAKTSDRTLESVKFLHRIATFVLPVP